MKKLPISHVYSYDHYILKRHLMAKKKENCRLGMYNYIYIHIS